MFAFLTSADGGRCELTCDDGGGAGAGNGWPPMVSVPHLVTNVSDCHIVTPEAPCGDQSGSPAIKFKYLNPISTSRVFYVQYFCPIRISFISVLPFDFSVNIIRDDTRRDSSCLAANNVFVSPELRAPELA